MDLTPADLGLTAVSQSAAAPEAQRDRTRVACLRGGCLGNLEVVPENRTGV